MCCSLLRSDDYRMTAKAPTRSYLEFPSRNVCLPYYNPQLSTSLSGVVHTKIFNQLGVDYLFPYCFGPQVLENEIICNSIEFRNSLQ